VIQAKQVQDRGVPVVDVALVLDGFVAVLVGGSVAEAAFDSAARHPGGVALVVVVSAVAALGCGGSAELSAPDDEGVFQHVSLLEIFEESGDRKVAAFCTSFVIDGQIRVLIPALMRHLDEANASLSKPSSQQTLFPEPVGRSAIDAVHVER